MNRVSPSRRLLQRTIRIACPPVGRSWIDAVFAEMDAVDAAGRAGWGVGALAILGAVVWMRATQISARIWWAIVIAAHALVVFAIGSRSDFDRVGFDDDVSLGAACATGVLLAGLLTVTINLIFRRSDAAA